MTVYWVWLSAKQNVTDRMKKTLLEHFGSPKDVWEASEAQLRQVPDMTPKQLEDLQEKDLDSAWKILEACDQKGIRLLTFFDEAYPNRLKNIYDPPIVLYYKGTFPDFDALPAIGLVGTRKASAYGLSVAYRLGYEVSKCGGLVVSGIAEGDDAAAMNGALAAGGSTVGILGCAIDEIYPKKNTTLFHAVEQHGCLISELGPGMTSRRWRFSYRNRIISGLSCGTVVVEAPEKSGALRTAEYANDQGRDVYAVPGNVDLPSFVGSNQLLNDGARAITCGWDVMREYCPLFPDKIHRDLSAAPTFREQKIAQLVVEPEPEDPETPELKPIPKEKSIDNGEKSAYSDMSSLLSKLSESEQQVVLSIGQGEKAVDDLIAETGFSAAKMLGLLTVLEVKRVIRRLPGKRVALR